MLLHKLMPSAKEQLESKIAHILSRPDRFTNRAILEFADLGFQLTQFLTGSFEFFVDSPALINRMSRLALSC